MSWSIGIVRAEEGSDRAKEDEEKRGDRAEGEHGDRAKEGGTDSGDGVSEAPRPPLDRRLELEEDIEFLG